MEIRVLVVNNNPLENNAFRDFAKFMPGITIIGTATGEAQGLRLLRSKRPDGLILNPVLDEGTGLNVLIEAGRMEPRPYVVALTDIAGAGGAVPWASFGFSYSRQNPACGPEAIFNLFLNAFRKRSGEEPSTPRDFAAREQERMFDALRTMDFPQRQLWGLLTMARLNQLVLSFSERAGRMAVYPDILKNCRNSLFHGEELHPELLRQYIILAEEAREYCFEPGEAGCGLSEGKLLDLGDVFLGLANYLSTFLPGVDTESVLPFRFIGAGKLYNHNMEKYNTSSFRRCPLFMEEIGRIWRDFGLIVSHRQDKRIVLFTLLREYAELDIRQEPVKPPTAPASGRKGTR